MEVKSGSDYKSHPALNNALKVSEWDIRKAYVFCKGNVSVREQITYLPWYMVMSFRKEQLPEHLIVNVDLENL